MSWLNKRAEDQIARARAEGRLTGLAGEGAPLPDRTGDAFVSAGDAIGFRVMAEAGVLPEEITLTDPDERNSAVADPARLELRQAIAENS